MDLRTTIAWLAGALFFGMIGVASAQDEAPAAEPDKPAIEQVSADSYRLGDIEFNSTSREIQFPGKVNQEEGILEYVLVHETGKTHESLLNTAISPADLQIVLKLLRYRAGKGKLFDGLYPPGELPEPEAEGTDVDVWVAWKGQEAVPVESLIRDLTTREAMTSTEWIYNGSEILNGKFMAEAEGSIIALYLDSLAMINSKHPRNGDDEIWFPLKDVAPAFDTPVTVILRPAKAKAEAE